MAVEMSQSVTIGHPTVLHTSHQGPAAVLNTLLHLSDPENDPLFSEHDCVTTIHNTTSPRPDLIDTPIPEAPNVFVDGSCSRPSDNVYRVAYAVVQLPNIVLEAEPISVNSAQAAELIALTRAGVLFSGQPVNIFTDSRYAFGVVHDFGKIWQQRGYQTTEGKPIAHTHLIEELLRAIQLPSDIAIIHCRAHTHKTDDISLGNALADQVAKQTATLFTPMSTFLLTPPQCPQDQILQHLQTFATQEDLAFWSKQGLTLDQAGLYSFQSKVGIPEASLPLLISQAHGIGHKSIKNTLTWLQQYFIANNLRRHCEDFVKTCITCIRANSGGTMTKHQHLPPPVAPFSHWQVDFTHIPKTGTVQEYLLVFTDHFSRWVEAFRYKRGVECTHNPPLVPGVEAFPTKREDARTVAKILASEIVPRYGCPQQINSDNGPAFVSKVLQELIKWLQVTWKFHVPYHPQSSGIVERMNRTIKDKLRKATHATWKHWKSFLPAILAEIHMTPNTTTKLSPFEIVMGRPFPTPWVKGPLVIMPGGLNLIQEEYVRNLITCLNGIYGDVSLSFPLPPQEPTHPFRPGDLVVVRHISRSRKGGFPFGPPTTVIAITRTAVLTSDSDNWIHGSRVKLAPTLSSLTTTDDNTKGSPNQAPLKDDKKILPDESSTEDYGQSNNKDSSLLFVYDSPFALYPHVGVV
ncbi:hypothetical protein XELAEV_18035274mg [Xenopus laevis]|uniref:Uncharacterized protein n=1 Tax=Xenopus laevis TaxID=8355 RepID=A0A974CGN5_XENLA|nr:hypothetical protein XELAEV_18035274mg [Xenopus laevis]